jgi:hypothetical protein
LQKRLAGGVELVLQANSAIASSASPRLRAVTIAAFAAVVRVLDAGKLEELLPVRALLVERLVAIADFDPARGAVLAQAGLLHVSEIFVPGYRATSQGPVLDRL